MKAEFLSRTNLLYGNDRLCDQFCLLTSGHSTDEIKLLKKEGSKIVCFGADENSLFYITALQGAGLEPDIIVDNRIESADSFLNNIPIVPPAICLNGKERYYFIITIKNQVFVKQVIQKLLFNGVKNFSILLLARTFDFERAKYKGLKNGFLKAFNELYEDINISHSNYNRIVYTFTNVVKWWILGIEWILLKYTNRRNLCILDVGPGSGLASLICKEVLDASLNWIMLENSVNNLTSYNRKIWQKHEIDVQFGYIEIEPFDGNYEIILFTEVLEHLVYNPVDTLIKLGSMLKPNGHLVISTPMKNGKGLPYFNSWRDLPKINNNSIKRNVEFLDISGQHHVYEYSHEEVKEIIDEAGLKVVYTEICDSFYRNMIFICTQKD